MRYQVQISVVWDVAPCNLVDIYRRLRSAHCLHFQGDEETVIVMKGMLSEACLIILTLHIILQIFSRMRNWAD
jgi:hypothetical protein